MALDPDPQASRVTIPEAFLDSEGECLLELEESERRSHWRQLPGGTYAEEYKVIAFALAEIQRGDGKFHTAARFVLDQFRSWCKDEVRDSAMGIYAVMHPTNRMVPREQLALDLFTWSSEFGPLQV